MVVYSIILKIAMIIMKMPNTLWRLNSKLCGSRKISISPPRREFGILVGWRVQKPRKFQRGGGLTVKLSSRWFSSIQYRPAAVIVRKLLLTDFGGTL